ncbi:ras association domain-containing protein 8 isoform X3 [Anabrus simplex]|uniref:ras association domain-containing protein 8 isoform X3 n=1 Tax=Anabrus simplex TaxID=316456 RepID=UPI0034DCD65E
MELKVWVEGIQRIVCGVTDNTTCQDVVYALAHATGKTGRFTLIERWRNNERLLAPNEHPLRILTKWGEYSSDVQFILQRSAVDGTKSGNQQQEYQSSPGQTGEDTVLYNAQYRDLVRLVNFQREKLSSLQAELTKFDAEIVFWEGKSREQQHQMEFLSQEAARMDKAARISEDQLRMLTSVEEESEIVRQQEKTLKSELTLLRSKLANCETELLQCKNKIRLLLEELQMEQRSLVRETEDRQAMERSLLSEVERLQRELEQAKQGAEISAQCGENLKREVTSVEAAIAEKKRQVERLVSEMKEANLQSLAIAPTDEIKHLLEGPHKPGSTRKMIGSPRQLENAVPTSKNPHGVWV